MCSSTYHLFTFFGYYYDLIFIYLIISNHFTYNITCHYHDTNGKALELVEASLDNGINTFHSSIKGLGGCPFSSKIVGNLSTEKLLEYLHSKDIKTGIDLDKIKNIRIF